MLAVCLPAAASAATPPNDSFASATTLVGAPIVTNGSNAGATKQPGEPNHAGDAGGRSVWWSWTAPFTGSVIIRTTGSSFDTLLAVYTGDAVATLTVVAANDQDLLDPLGGDTSRVKFDAAAGTVYRVAVDGFSGASGSIILTIEAPVRPPNDNFADRIALSGPTVLTHGTNRKATREEGEPMHAGEPGGKSVWWTWTAPLSGPTIITTLGSDFDTLLSVGVGDVIDDLTLVAANDQDPLGGDTSRVTFEARAGTRYEIAVDGWNAESGGIILTLDMPPAPPMLSQPRLLAAGAFQVILFGAAGRTYVMEARTNATAGPWVSIATNLSGPTGMWTFTDSAAASFPRRFYRARLQE
jgi:hypothetical protein